MNTSKRTGLDWRDRKMIIELYKNQETIIKIGNCISTARIRRGVRQGCSLSPYLFNIFIEEIVQEFKVKTKDVKINGKVIHCIRFADDIAMVTETAKDMQQSLTVFNEILKRYLMKINIRKTKIMVVSKESRVPTVKIRLDNKEIDQVHQYTYLGSILTSDSRCSVEIRHRIAMAKRAFIQKKQLLTNKNLNLKTRKNFVKSYVWSVLLYGSETWTLTAQDKKKIKAMEMWTWRRLLCISWTERKRNEEILRIVEEKRVLLSIIRSRSGKLIGHKMRYNLFITNIIEGRINGRKGRHS